MVYAIDHDCTTEAITVGTAGNIHTVYRCPTCLKPMPAPPDEVEEEL